MRRVNDNRSAKRGVAPIRLPRQRWIWIAAAASATLSCEMLTGEFELARTVPSDDAGGSPGEVADAATSSDASASLEDSATGAPDNPCMPFPAYRCMGGVLQNCEVNTRGDRVYTDQQDCGQQAQCDSNAGRCLVCSPGSFRCVDERLEQCDGADWIPEQDCAASELRCDADLGDCAVCLLNEDRCNGDDELNKCVLGPQGREWVSVSCGGFPCRSLGSGADYCQQCTSEGESHCLSQISSGDPTLLVTCGGDFRYRTIPCDDGLVCEAAGASEARCVQ